MDEYELIEKVTDYLLAPDNNGYLKAAINDSNPYLARIAVRLCFENPLFDNQEIVDESLSHGDIIVRRIASNHLGEFTGDVLEKFIEKAPPHLERQK